MPAQEEDTTDSTTHPIHGKRPPEGQGSYVAQIHAILYLSS